MKVQLTMRAALMSSLPIFIGLPSVAIAQDAVGQAPAANREEVSTGGLRIEEVVVKAQRRSQNLQKVPIAVVALSSDGLKAAAVTNTIELNVVTPGLTIRTGAGAFNPYIRGIGTSANIVENPVALYVDGVYYPQQREGMRNFNDVEQIAVLKGPQGTLFGRNATAGVIQITTKKPRFEFEGNAGVSIDNYATLDGDIYVTGPISDKVAYSFSGQYIQQFNGYGTNLTTGRDTYRIREVISVRGKVLVEASDRTSLMLIGDYMQRDVLSDSFQPLPGTTFSIPGIAPIANRYDSRASDDEFSAFSGGGVSLKVEHEFNSFSVMSISAYRKGTGQSQFFPFPDPAGSMKVAYSKAGSELFSQEVQILSEPGEFSWVLGAYYFNYTNGTQPTRVFFNAPPFFNGGPFDLMLIENFGDEKAESIAPFGQFDWEFAENTTLTGGLRWTYEKRTADLNKVLTFGSGFVVSVPLNDSTTYRNLSYRIALAHEFTPDVMGYISHNKGFKSGGYSINNSTNPAYEPEELKAYEAGVKLELLNGQLRVNTAAYYYDYVNLQVTRIDVGTQIVENGAAAELYGVDVDVVAQVTDGLTVTGSLALEHTEFTDYPNAALQILQPDGSNVEVEGSAKGNRLPLAQEVSGMIALDYHSDMSSGGMLDVNVTAKFNGDYFFEPFGGMLHQGAFVMLNTTLKYTMPNEQVTFTIFAKNILDKAILSFPVTQEHGFDANYEAPRTFGISARVNF